MRKTLLVVDGNNQVFRNEWGTGLYHKNQRVSGILSFLRSLRMWVKNYSCSNNVVVCWDSRSKKKNIYDKYKFGRVRDDFYKQVMSEIVILQEMLKSLGIKQLKEDGYEADDLIADVVYSVSGKKIIVSTDSDLFQLLTKDTMIIRGKAKFTIDDLRKKWGMTPDEYFFFKVVSGDMMDNIPGIKGIGKIRFLKILDECGHNLERMLCHRKIVPHLKLVERNYQLIKLEKLNLQRTREVLVKDEYPDVDKFRVQCYRYGLFSILKNFQEYISYFRRVRRPR